MGTRKGTFPVTIRQRQSVPLFMTYLRDLQQSEVGEELLLPPLLMKFMQGLKLRSMAALHTVLICPETDCVLKIIKTRVKIEDSIIPSIFVMNLKDL